VEQWTTLSVVVGATTELKVGTFVSNVMNRHPALVARMAATLQLASEGRFTLGIGIGGGAPEHRAYGIDFPDPPERAARLEEAVAVIRALWTGGPVTRPSPFYPLAEAHAFPVPDPAPRILIGAGTPAGDRLAAKVGDGWAAELDGFEALLPAYCEALAADGRSIDDAWIALGFGGGRSNEDALRGSPWVERPRDEWARWAAQGVDEAIVSARTPNDIKALVRAVDRW
jgi:alkanesulfonate monooxygenase SsuD/methylene tetrahydromethanopterin reductase-like flavin-dependent oxidoreductase (luciferase family)